MLTKDDVVTIVNTGILNDLHFFMSDTVAGSTSESFTPDPEHPSGHGITVLCHNIFDGLHLLLLNLHWGFQPSTLHRGIDPDRQESIRIVILLKVQACSDGGACSSKIVERRSTCAPTPISLHHISSSH